MYSWDEEDRLVRSSDGATQTEYRYGADGQRALKYGPTGESLYFDAMWMCTSQGITMTKVKNIYVGSERIATRLSHAGESSQAFERLNTYYYHGGLLGSGLVVTDSTGAEYERVEATPYGETWIGTRLNEASVLPYSINGREVDSKTDLTYYGARYMNPKTGLWISADPAMVTGEYIPTAESSANNLSGLGGVTNLSNLNPYTYCASNPISFVDPTGRVNSIPCRPNGLGGGGDSKPSVPSKKPTSGGKQGGGRVPGGGPPGGNGSNPPDPPPGDPGSSDPLQDAFNKSMANWNKGQQNSGQIGGFIGQCINVFQNGISFRTNLGSDVKFDFNAKLDSLGGSFSPSEITLSGSGIVNGVFSSGSGTIGISVIGKESIIVTTDPFKIRSSEEQDKKDKLKIDIYFRWRFD